MFWSPEVNWRFNHKKCQFGNEPLKTSTSEGIRNDPDNSRLFNNYNSHEPSKPMSIISKAAASLRRRFRKFKKGIGEIKKLRFKKVRLAQAPLLACPDFAESFIVQTDASDGLGVVLTT